VSVTVSGSGMGMSDYTGAARTGGTACETTLGWTSDTAIVCSSCAGVRGSRRATLTVGLCVATSTEMVSYDISSKIGADLFNAPSLSHVDLVVHASGLGVASYSPHLRQGGTSCESSMWLSDSSVRSRTASGVAGTRTVRVTVGSRAGTVTEAMSYDRLVPLPNFTVVNSSDAIDGFDFNVTTFGGAELVLFDSPTWR